MFINQKDTICERCRQEIPIGAWFEPLDDGDICQECRDRMWEKADIDYDEYKESKIH